MLRKISTLALRRKYDKEFFGLMRNFSQHNHTAGKWAVAYLSSAYSSLDSDERKGGIAMMGRLLCKLRRPEQRSESKKRQRLPCTSRRLGSVACCVWLFVLGSLARVVQIKRVCVNLDQRRFLFRVLSFENVEHQQKGRVVLSGNTNSKRDVCVFSYKKKGNQNKRKK